MKTQALPPLPAPPPLPPSPPPHPLLPVISFGIISGFYVHEKKGMLLLLFSVSIFSSFAHVYMHLHFCNPLPRSPSRSLLEKRSNGV